MNESKRSYNDLYMNVQRSFIYNSPKLEATHMLIHELASGGESI